MTGIFKIDIYFRRCIISSVRKGLHIKPQIVLLQIIQNPILTAVIGQNARQITNTLIIPLVRFMGIHPYIQLFRAESR